MPPVDDKLLRLAYTIVLLSLLYLFCVTFVPIPNTGEDNAKYIVGFLVGTGLTTIIAFYFKRVGASPELPTNGGTGTTDSTITKHTETKPEEVKP
jgi:hypothetical protein